MPDLSFQVDSAEPVNYAASPLLALKLRVTNADDAEPVNSVILQCQIRLEPSRRHYDAREQDRLVDLFGEPPRWGQTLRSMLWTHTTTIVPQFLGQVTVDLHVPCTFDFNIAATKYFNGLEQGDVVLTLLFSGTIFFRDADGFLQITQIPWEKEAAFRFPVRVWKEMMDHYYPNIAWLCLRRDVFDRLHEYKRAGGLATWEQAMESLLPDATKGVAS